MVEKQTPQPLKRKSSQLFCLSAILKKRVSLWITTGFIGLLRTENQEIEDVIPS